MAITYAKLSHVPYIFFCCEIGWMFALVRYTVILPLKTMHMHKS